MIQQLLLLESIWHLPEYKKLFGAKSGEPFDQCLQRQIELMAHANSKVNAWQDVIDTHDKHGLCTNLHIHTLCQKCQLLGLAYPYARLTMNQFAEYGIQDAKFQDCCKKAIDDLRPLGIKAATNELTLMK
jgi:hypothetical protein